MFNKILLSVVLLVSSVNTFSNDNAYTKNTVDFTKSEKFERYPAGAASHSHVLNSDAFSFPSSNMSFDRQLLFSVGNRLFTRSWLSGKSDVYIGAGGVGPLLNAQSCQSCHFKDGRGHLPSSDKDNAISLILKIQTIGGEASATYGRQLQDFAVEGEKAEGKISVKYETSEVQLKDGTNITLRKPSFSVKDLGYGDFDQETVFLPRIAPPMMGLGMLDAISDIDIVSNADELDADANGISGRVSYIRDNGLDHVGRFGWKATAIDLKHQTQIALSNDMGLSSTRFTQPHGDCTLKQDTCIELAQRYLGSKEFELNDELLNALVFYVRNLAVPERREESSAEVLQGKEIFYQSGCADCHRPKYITSNSIQNIEQSRQLIWPYTDLLLHDMGEGLSDPFPKQSSAGIRRFAREWRTPPLWGIGLTGLVNREYGFLHDGRARTLLEAIMWHGGEALASRNKVTQLTSDQRRKLLLFINSL